MYSLKNNHKYIRKENKMSVVNFLKYLVSKTNNNIKYESGVGLLKKDGDKLVFPAEELLLEFKEKFGVTDEVIELISSVLLSFKPKDSGWFTPKKTADNSLFSDGISDGNLSVLLLSVGGYIIHSDNLKLSVKPTEWKAEIDGKLYSGKPKVAVTNNKEASDLFFGGNK